MSKKLKGMDKLQEMFNIEELQNMGFTLCRECNAPMLHLVDNSINKCGMKCKKCGYDFACS